MAYQRVFRQLALLRDRIVSPLFFCRTVLALGVFFLLATGAFSVPPSLDVHAAMVSSTDSEEHFNMPRKYGEVIYRIHPERNKQLYIIGISHRSAITGDNGSTTVEAQKEIYRIGEWLNKSTQLDLLLPEGYFNETDCTNNPSHQVMAKGDRARYHVDSTQLERELAAKAFTNAEMLLMKHLSFRACQVEDNSIYQAVRGRLDELSNTKDHHSDIQQVIKDIRYLQEVRTAQLLQDIPGIIENQFDSSETGKRRAMFTIGLNHIKYIFRYIESGNIDIKASLKAEKGMPLDRTPLNLLKAGYGISIILPRSLAENDQLLEKTQIDRILLAQSND